MFAIKDDVSVLTSLCLTAIERPNPHRYLEDELIRYGLGSRREVHFCRGFLAALMAEVAGNRRAA